MKTWHVNGLESWWWMRIDVRRSGKISVEQHVKSVHCEKMSCVWSLSFVGFDCVPEYSQFAAFKTLTSFIRLKAQCLCWCEKLILLIFWKTYIIVLKNTCVFWCASRKANMLFISSWYLIGPLLYIALQFLIIWVSICLVVSSAWHWRLPENTKCDGVKCISCCCALSCVTW